jgi:hypothetical protein
MSMPPSVDAMTHDAARLAVDEHREVELARDVEALLDVEALDLLALGAGLLGDERACRGSSGDGLPRPRRRPCDLHAAALPRPPAWICALTTTTSLPVSAIDALREGPRG